MEEGKKIARLYDEEPRSNFERKLARAILNRLDEHNELLRRQCAAFESLVEIFNRMSKINSDGDEF